jgi:hypothetical protein
MAKKNDSNEKHNQLSELSMPCRSLKRLVAGCPTVAAGFAFGQHVGFMVDKAAL